MSNPNYPPHFDPSPFTLAVTSTPQNITLPENDNLLEHESADSFIYFDQSGQVQPSQSRSVSSAQSVPVTDATYQYPDSSLVPVAGAESMQQLVRYGYCLWNIQD